MAETTTIEWCDSTWNPWIGCTDQGLRFDADLRAREFPSVEVAHG
jgi:hypothetical protein